MAEAAAGVAYGLKNVAEGAAILAKGIYDPTLPLRAHLQPLTSVDLPRAHHSVSVVKGRAYIFGSQTSSQTHATFADNAMHIVMLPTSAMESMDYKRVAPASDAPAPRAGHAAAVIEDRIYVFGGHDVEGAPLDEQGRVWVFDTNHNTWSYLDPPPNGARPGKRSACSAVASEHPRAMGVKTKADEGILPQQPPDPEEMVPEVPAPDTYGTLIVQAGKGEGEAPLNDLWSFDISTRSWTELPEPPVQTGPRPSVAFVGNRLYLYAAGLMSYLDLTNSSFDDRGGKGELEVAPLGPWSSMAHSGEAETVAHPGSRVGAAMVAVTTGQGRNYLLLVGGETPTGEVLEDVWSLQLKPEGMTAASFKDAARQAIKKETNEARWEEVKYLDAAGTLIQEGQKGRGVGIRQGLAAAKGAEIDGASVLLWGGFGADGKSRGDGLVVSVDR